MNSRLSQKATTEVNNMIVYLEHSTQGLKLGKEILQLNASSSQVIKAAFLECGTIHILEGNNL